MISVKLKDIQEEILLVCNRLGRNPESINLVGVTKYAKVEAILEGVQAGLLHIGENKVQEAQIKFPVLEKVDHSVTKHLIGHLQTNKVKDAIETFDLIQSVDSIKLVKEIEKQAEKLERDVNILIQVNVAGEEQKFGVNLDQTDALVEAAANCEHIKVQGLMTIAPFTEDKEVIRSCFRGLKEMFDRYTEIYKQHTRVNMEILSMGMTSDYVMALEEGANMIRVGRAIFQ